ncbi:uncharacterized protein SPAPADRAFT_50397 [Spathaspora passalidarum NRRL Y-27907]|uniref:BRCT domain-containing protein n=1 Tax=Spathaspora passalidarum (strain NRRL Y-27907 / 11-Y1) TaxID=619300 RepID=G3AMT0_SPAPN|nr:uncharacterized protein SPAPADRAFT_50397 [Spathaspora passalidarum NRRL Y-27907]EGW33524.1 hypothetical protein SPAPADRAFT_50397 [Spathaspora passalidarum NRRL Y-27907]
MFSESSFLIVKSEKLADAEGISKILNENNASAVFIKDDFDNKVNYLSPNPQITHIITESVDFVEYEQAIQSMIPITTSQWVHDSLAQSKIQNIKSYNPDPKYFFHDCFICCADNLPEGDKEIIYGTASAFGAGYLDVLTKYTTHLIAVDLTNEKSIVANSVINSKIKIVVPEWIDHCITLGRKVDENDYLLPNPKILQSDAVFPTATTVSSNDPATNGLEHKSTFLKGKKIYLSQDYNLSKRQNTAICKYLESHEAIICEKFNPDIDIYLGKYRHGEHYIQSCKNPNIVVGTLAYLYNLIITNKWILPTSSQLLHYPLPMNPIPQFTNLKISISNYSGDSRAYLARLISIMGGTFTKTLTRENDYLVCSKPEGKKYLTAKEKWVDETGKPIVKIVNHLWVEECFAQWELQDSNQEKYNHFPKDSLMEASVGNTKLNSEVLKSWYADDDDDDEESKDNEGNVDDSMSEDQSTKRKTKETEQVPDANASTDSKEELMDNSEPASPSTTQTSAKSSSPQVIAEPHHTPVGSRRSAAKRAAAKLHEDMSDLNQYQQMTKSSRKMKEYMTELEHLSSSPNKLLSSPPVKKHKPNKKCEIIAVMTGCESIIDLSADDIANLQNVGVEIISDLSTQPNTLIAPKILRTEKFLRSLAKVDHIVHPKYLIDVLKNVDKQTVLTEFNIEDYRLDKVTKLDQELGKNGLNNLLTSPNKGKLFQDLSFNMSSNLNGGVDVIARILHEHGMKDFHEIKSATKLAKTVIDTHIESTDQVILLANKTKDTKLIAAFKKQIKNGIALEWDWCVKSIFKMQLQNLDDFKL